MKNELKVVTFTGAELYSLLPTDIQMMYQFNVVKQHGGDYFLHLLKKDNFLNMKHFVQSGFLFSEAIPFPSFWKDLAISYTQEFEDAAISEII